jgi:hypothetical protein
MTVKSRRLRTGHVTHVGIWEIHSLQYFDQKTSKENFGKPRRRWEENIKRVRRERRRECMVWIRMTQDEV